MLAKDKHSSILRKFVTFGRKKFYNHGPRSLKICCWKWTKKFSILSSATAKHRRRHEVELNRAFIQKTIHWQTEIQRETQTHIDRERLRQYSTLIIDIQSLQNRLLKVCYVPATSACLPRLLFIYLFIAVAINSTNDANKAGGTHH